MDLSNAALLVGAVYAVVEWAKVLFPKMTARVVVLVTLIASVLLTFLVAATVWADTQIVSGVALDKMRVADLLLVSLLLALSSSVLHAGFDAVRNVGENN